MRKKVLLSPFLQILTSNCICTRMLHFISNILSLSSHGAKATHITRINSGNTCFAWSWVIRSWFTQLLQWKCVVTHPQQTEVRNQFAPFLHLLPRWSQAFFLPISEQVAQFGGGKRKQLLQIKEKLESIYDFHLKPSHPNCLVTWTDKHGWAVTVIQILNDHLFRPVNKHCSVASLLHLSWSRGVFQLPSVVV